MADLTTEEIDKKFNEIFHEEHFQPNYSNNPTTVEQINGNNQTSPSFYDKVAGLVGFGAGKAYQNLAPEVLDKILRDRAEAAGKPYSNAWGEKTGYGIGEGTTREQSEAYKRQYKSMGEGNRKIDVSRRINVDDVLEELARKEAAANPVGRFSKEAIALGDTVDSFLQKLPKVGTGLGALGTGMDTVEAKRRYDKGDIPGALIAGAGALGTGTATFMPAVTPWTAAAKGIGAGVGIASPLALMAWDYARGK